MELRLQQFIFQLLKKAHYEYDPSIKAWSGWIDGFPSVYAQGKGVEEVREELISTLEDYLLINFKKGVKVPGFSLAR